MLDILTNIKLGIVTVAIATATLFGYVPQTQAPIVANEPMLGGTFVTPSAVGLFTTSLASKITSSDTSMTLVSGLDKDGNTLASSTYGFIIDEGTSVEEFVLADCTGTACTNMTRGVSVTTATTSVAALKFEHRRGASVKITTHPAVVFAINVLKGRQNVENKLRYNTAQTFTNATDIISKDYADALSFGAVPEATETASGFGEVATGVEVASSTSSGSEARLLIPASLATSTYNSATAALKVVVTQNDGKIDGDFLDLSTFTGNLTPTNVTITGTSNIASSSIYATTTSGTWTKPANLRYLIVELVGGGGGSGGCTDSARVSLGGSGGNYAKKIIPASALGATETVTIGAAGGGGSGTAPNPGTAGGSTSFGSHVTAAGGTAGTECNANPAPSTAAPAAGTSGDINLSGGASGYGLFVSNTAALYLTPSGGDSWFGKGGEGEMKSSANITGHVGTGYGAGGSGAASVDNNDVNGAAGTAGIVIFTYFYY